MQRGKVKSLSQIHFNVILSYLINLLQFLASVKYNVGTEHRRTGAAIDDVCLFVLRTRGQIYKKS